MAPLNTAFGGVGTAGPVAMRQAQGRTLFIAALVLLLVTRLALIGLQVHQFSDLAWYEARALELLRTGRYAENGVATAYWPVGYPAFLAGAMWLFGGAAWAGQVANLLLSAGCLLLLHRWCLQRWRDPVIAGWSVLLLAVYPNHMGYTPGLYSEPLFTALLLGMCVCLKPAAAWSRVALAGLLMGCAILVKAQMLLLGPLLAVVLLMPGASWRGLVQALKPAMLAGLVAGAVLSPWALRNASVMGAPIPVSTNGGMSLLAANNPSMTSDLRSDFNEDDDLVRSARFSVADQVAADRRAKAIAWGWIADNPGRFLALMPKKLFRLWAMDGESDWLFQAGYPAYDQHSTAFRTVRIVNQLFYVAALALCALALWKLFDGRRPVTWELPLMVAFFSALCMVFSGQSRYHAPLMPLILAHAAWWGVHWLRRRQAQ